MTCHFGPEGVCTGTHTCDNTYFECFLGYTTSTYHLEDCKLHPIPKETNISTLHQLRPIYVTDVIMRLFERLVLDFELRKPVSSFIHSDQFAYKKHCGNETALLYNQHFWMRWLDGVWGVAGYSKYLSQIDRL